jgi:hypothetical protein
MKTLRLMQTNLEDGHYRVELVLERAGGPALKATAEFEFLVDVAGRGDVLWYLDDYLQDPVDPPPLRAVRAEQRIQDNGTALFDAVFLSTADCRKLWDAVSDSLDSTRIEIMAPSARELPWEMMFDPHRSVFVASLAAAFERGPASPKRPPARTLVPDAVKTFW